MLGCPVEVYEKSDGTFKRLFDFGTKNGTDRIVRIAFTGGDHYRYLEAGGLGPAAAGQGPSADPPADHRAEDPDFDGGALVGLGHDALVQRAAQHAHDLAQGHVRGGTHRR